MPVKGDKIWNVYFIPRVSPRTLAVGSATIEEIEVHKSGYYTEYHIKLSYDETDSIKAFGDDYQKYEQKFLWELHLTPEDAIKSYINERSCKLRDIQRDIDEANLLLESVRK